MKIYIVRHGQTESNKQNKLVGQRVDDALTPEGIRQAEELAEAIDSDFDIIFTSPMKRTLQTAEIIANKIKAPIIKIENLKERDYGTLSGNTLEEISKISGQKLVDLKKQFLESSYDYRPYGGECAEDIKNRLLAFVTEVKNNYKNKKILVIAHGGIIRIAHNIFLEEKPEHIKNASVYEFDV